MNNKKIILIIFVIVVVLCALVVTILLLLQINSNQSTVENPPTSYVSYPNAVGPDGKPIVKDYEYALINKDDNIKIKTLLGEELLISIDSKNWKEVQWSKDGSYVSALGETKKGVYNLFVYNIKTQDWRQITTFDSNGVSSYQWVNDDQLLFTEGGWLHSYKYSSVNEILKIYQIDAVIVSLSPNKSTVILKSPSNIFSILSVEGKLLFTLDQINIKGSDQTLKIKEIHYNADSETLLLITDTNKFYDWGLGDSEATELTINSGNIKLSSVNIMCSEEIDKFKTYTLTSSEVDFYNLDLNNNKLNSVTTKTSEEKISSTLFQCLTQDDFIFDIVNTDKNNWYEVKGDKIDRLVVLDEAVEAAMK